SALPPGDLHGRVDDVGGVGAGADDRGVHAVLSGEVQDLALPVGFVRVDSQRRARFLGDLAGLRVDVDTEDDASGCLGDAGGQLPHQAEAVHGDNLAELDVCPAQRLHGDAADGDERSVAQVDTTRYGNDVVDGRRRQFGVPRCRERDRLADV